MRCARGGFDGGFEQQWLAYNRGGSYCWAQPDALGWGRQAIGTPGSIARVATGQCPNILTEARDQCLCLVTAAMGFSMGPLTGLLSKGGNLKGLGKGIALGGTAKVPYLV